MTLNLPPEYNPSIYRSLHIDLADLDEVDLYGHYKHHGIAEGRSANHINNRNEFANLALTGNALEIGPFASPLLKGDGVDYADTHSKEDLIKRALTLGISPANVPDINWRIEPSSLETVTKEYDSVLSSHVVEHSPDLVTHLQQVQDILRSGGMYFALIPDHRYCFDHFMAPSSIASVLDAWNQKRKFHTLCSYVEHRLLTTHNDAKLHWLAEHGCLNKFSKDELDNIVFEYNDSDPRCIDVHAWYFTPDSWRSIVDCLHMCGLLSLKVLRVYPTRRYANEFWTVLEKL